MVQYINKAYLLTGGNVGERLVYLQRAVELIGKSCGNVMNKSAVYETAAWGNTQQGMFLNQAIELHSSLNPSQLMSCLLKIEEELGRKRSEKYGPRIIDIDILLFNNEIFRGADLIIPHEQLQNRRFALKPLSDIAGDLVHPVLKRSVHQLLAECPDELEVKQID